MKLTYGEYGIELNIMENQINILVAESPTFFSKLIETFCAEKRNGDGNIILSEKDKIITFSKIAEIIIDPFSIDPNERRIMQKLYQELCTVTVDRLFVETSETHARVVSYLEEMIQKVPYHVTFDIEENIPNLLKAYNVRLETEGVTLLERIVEYLRLLHQLCKIKVIIFVNLKTYLSDSELEQLYEFSAYEKISLVLLENVHRNRLKNEKICIVDHDCCIINLE